LELQLMAATIIQPDNVAVVTGAALGIGRAMCKRFVAAAGMSVVVADLPGEELDALRAISRRGPDRILEAATDVADPEQVQRLRDTVMAKFGKVNLLANNAATVSNAGMGRPWRTGAEPWTSTSGVHSRGAGISARHAGVHGGRRDRQCWLQAGDH
jgi:NAD(P)-dependent dehydrogenase (short-subunit alcohol dehydrogenase family)